MKVTFCRTIRRQPNTKSVRSRENESVFSKRRVDRAFAKVPACTARLAMRARSQRVGSTRQSQPVVRARASGTSVPDRVAMNAGSFAEWSITRTTWWTGNEEGEGWTLFSSSRDGCPHNCSFRTFSTPDEPQCQVSIV